jgi:hypothetical protein
MLTVKLTAANEQRTEAQPSWWRQNNCNKWRQS